MRFYLYEDNASVDVCRQCALSYRKIAEYSYQAGLAAIQDGYQSGFELI